MASAKNAFPALPTKLTTLKCCSKQHRCICTLYPQIIEKLAVLILLHEYLLEGLMLKLQYSGHLMRRAESLEKTLMLGKIEQEEKRATDDEMVGWLHRLNGHEFEQTPEDSEGQGRLVCCRPWGRKESDMT